MRLGAFMSRLVVAILGLLTLACAGVDSTGPFPAEDGSTVYMDGDYRTTLDPLVGFVWLGPPDGTAKYGFDGQTWYAVDNKYSLVKLDAMPPDAHLWPEPPVGAWKDAVERYQAAKGLVGEANVQPTEYSGAEQQMMDQMMLQHQQMLMEQNSAVFNEAMQGLMPEPEIHYSWDGQYIGIY